MRSLNDRLSAQTLVPSYKRNHWRALRRWGFATLATIALTLSSTAYATSDYIPPKVDTSTPTGVSLSDTSFIYSNTDISIGPLTLERYHLGGLHDASQPFFGTHMSHNFDMYVAQNFHSATTPPLLSDRFKPIVHMGQSASGVYHQVISTGAITPSSFEAEAESLQLVSGDYVFTAHDGTVYTFTHTVSATPSGSQRIANIVYPGGRTVTFSYVSGKLRVVTDNSGYALVFDYNGSGYVSAACGFNLAVTYVSTSTTCASASLKVSYAYSGDGLASVTDVMGETTTFTGGGDITCIKPPTHSTCRITNTYGKPTDPWQITQQTLADGAVWNFDSTGAENSRDPDILYPDAVTATLTVTDPLAHTAHYEFSQTSPHTYTDPLGRETDYVYTGGNDFEAPLMPGYNGDIPQGRFLVSVVYPEHNRYDAEYNGQYHSISRELFTPKPSSSESAAEILYTYPTGTCANRLTCTQPLTRTDPRGAVTNFDYESSGLIHYQMDPSPASLSYASRPLRLYTYVQRYAYIKNSGGTLVPASSATWVHNTETQCQTVAGSSTYNTPTCDPSGPQIVTTYNYPANGATHTNLLPSSTTVSGGATSTTTAVVYTDAGDAASIDGPRSDVTDVTYTVYDAMRRKVWEIGGDTGGATHAHRVIIHHVYSADGNETSTETGHGDATDGSDFVISEYRHMTYDGMGRLIRTETGTP